MRKKSHKKNEDFWEQSLKLMKQCPICNLEYASKSFQIIEETEESKLVHMTCPHCKHKMMAVVMQTELGMSSLAVVTDLTALDAQKFSKKEPVSENDILYFHNLLETKTQEMSSLF